VNMIRRNLCGVEIFFIQTDLTNGYFFLIAFPLLILWNQTYQNPVVVTLALTVTGTSAFQFIRQLRILRKRRML
jgi:hypothetical protein